jgi:hypothetical protein
VLQPGARAKRASGDFFLVVHCAQSLFLAADCRCDALRLISQRVVERPLMEQISLIVDSLNDAIRDTARAIGFKRIAKELWPSKGEEAAARYLNDCLNPDREQKLSGEEILLIARRGREIGCHIITGFINMETGYAPPIPVDPENEKAELQRQFNENVLSLHKLAARIERTGKR